MLWITGRESEAFFADPEAECQVFHRCIAVFGVFFKYSFLCPHGSVFNQEYSTCDWWYRVQCKEDQEGSARDDKGEEELAIDVGESNTNDGVTKGSQRPIIIQTIIFDDERFEDNTVSTEFGSNEWTKAINKGIQSFSIGNNC